MKILVDALGGDNAPQAVLEGCALALSSRSDLELVIAGPENVIKEGLAKRKADLSKVEILPAEEAVLNSDHPAMFLKTKPNCSLAVAFEALRKRDDISALVSCGPTGAVLTGSVLRIGRIPGISRPALLATLPTRKESLVRMLDVGANMDCKPEYLYQFAIMADTYLKMIGIENPRIGLLNVGCEEGKGNDLVKATFNLLKASELNFIGSIEADHVLDGDCDLVVCDGFAGNVFIKSLEGASFFMKDLFVDAIKGNPWRAIGALFQLRGLKKVKRPFAFANKACAPLLGTKKLVLKAHGKSKGDVIGNAILEAASLAEKGLTTRIELTMAKPATTVEEAAK